MVGESLEEMASSFRFKDERIFISMVHTIKSGGDVIPLDIIPDGERLEVVRTPSRIGGSTYLLFGDKLDTFISDGKEYLNEYDLDNFPNLVPISTVERIMSIELVTEDAVVSTNNIEKPLDRFYSYIRTLR